MERSLRTCKKCKSPALALRRKRISLMGMMKHYGCRACGAQATVGSWGSVAINLVIALVVIPAILFIQQTITLDSIPKGALVAAGALVGLSIFEVWRLRRFDKQHPVGGSAHVEIRGMT